MTKKGYVDDTLLFVDTEEKLQELVSASRSTSVERGIVINVGKGKQEVLGLGTDKKKRKFEWEYYIGRKGRTTSGEVYLSRICTL